MIDGFRYGFFGMSDISPWFSLSVVIASFITLSLITIGMLKAGYKLRG
jgi:ABC-2 type transport system permease protein